MTDEQSLPDNTRQPPPESAPLVLVVDDSKVMRLSLSRLLGKTYRVLEAENGEKGWEKLQMHPDVELVFSDLSMPVMDGFELLTLVRNSDDANIRELPFVVITGHEDDEGMQEKAVELGASDFISKPFRSTEITARAKTLTAQRRDMRELQQDLAERATVDAVTGLSTSEDFLSRCDQMLSLSRRHGLDSSFLLVQLERPGEQPGETSDLALRTLADLLASLVRTEDAIGYLGDGGYGLVLSGADREGALAWLARLQHRLEDARQTPLQDVTLSVGLSISGAEQAFSAEDLLQSARSSQQPLDSALPAAVTAQENEVASPADESQSEVLELQEQLAQTRESLLQAEQAGQLSAEKLRRLQEGARAQITKAHQQIASLRAQLTTTQAKFRSYMESHSPQLQQQTELELEQLRAVLAEREEQLENEQTLRRQAQEMIQHLQGKLTALTEQQEAEASKPRGLSRLFKRD